MATAKLRVVGVLLFIVVLILSGTVAVCLVQKSNNESAELGHTKGTPELGPTTEDIKKYGSEEDARHKAELSMIKRIDRYHNFTEVVRWFLQFWKEPASKRTMDELPHAGITDLRARPPFDSDPERYGVRLCTLNAKLDRQKGEWLVVGVLEFCRGGSSEAMEVDWQYVLRYDPTSGRWDSLNGGWQEDNGLELRWSPYAEPIRFRLRSVGTKEKKMK